MDPVVNVVTLNVKLILITKVMMSRLNEIVYTK